MQLGRADVLRGARELIDADGLDALTMRKLGAHLEVPAGALDRHFASRQAVLDAIAGQLVAAVADAPPAGPWDQRLVTMAHRLRRSLLGMRDGARLLAETVPAEPGALLASSTGTQILIDAGMKPDKAAWALLALSHYIIGHTIEEQSPSAAAPADSDRRFDFGLGLLIDGIRRYL